MVISNTKPPSYSSVLTLTKICKANLAGRPIISRCDGLTERISSFIDSLLQPIMKEQQSYLKDTTHFINIVEGTIVPKNTILVSMDVTSLYTNIPQEEGITTICKAYDIFYKKQPSDTNKLSERNAQTYTTRKLFPIYWKRPPSDSGHCNGNKNGGFLRQYFYGKDRNRNNKPLH